MSKRLILALALVFVLGMTVGAYAEAQNIKVSGDLESDVLYRNRFDFLGKSETTNDGIWGGQGRGTSDTIFLNIARLRVDADLTDNVSATIRLIGEWLWGRNSSNNSVLMPFATGPMWENAPINRGTNPGIDIDLAYATLKEFLYSPLTLVIGRQELHYGNDMIIGDVDTNRIDARGNIPGDLSKRKSFDAVRAILNYDPLTVDMVYAKVNTVPWWQNAGFVFAPPWYLNQNSVGEIVGDRIDNDTDLYGINAKYDLGRKNTIVEAYYWYKRIGPYAMGTNPAAGLDWNGFITKSDQVHTLGARISTQPIENLTFQLEGAIQRGRAVIGGSYGPYTGYAFTGAKRSAWAMETALSYDFKKVKYTPSVTALFAYFSGQEPTYFYPAIGNHKFRGWDPMFENQCFGHIANALIPQTNIKVVGVTATMKPTADVTLKGEYYRYWFNDPYWVIPTYFIPTYFNAQALNGNSRDAGQELDLTVTYDYTDDVQFSLLGAVLFPGNAFDQGWDSPRAEKSAQEIMGSMKVTF